MKAKMIMIVALLLVLAAPLVAQQPAGSSPAIPLIPAALAMGLASGLCGVGQGRAVASAVEGIARNPGALGAIRATLLLGLAFIESLALFTFVLAR